MLCFEQQASQRLTDKQHESVLEAEAKVKQLQLTVLKLQQQIVMQQCEEAAMADSDEGSSPRLRLMQDRVDLLQQEVSCVFHSVT